MNGDKMQEAANAFAAIVAADLEDAIAVLGEPVVSMALINIAAELGARHVGKQRFADGTEMTIEQASKWKTEAYLELMKTLTNKIRLSGVTVYDPATMKPASGMN